MTGAGSAGSSADGAWASAPTVPAGDHDDETRRARRSWRPRRSAGGGAAGREGMASQGPAAEQGGVPGQAASRHRRTGGAPGARRGPAPRGPAASEAAPAAARTRPGDGGAGGRRAPPGPAGRPGRGAPGRGGCQAEAAEPGAARRAVALLSVGRGPDAEGPPLARRPLFPTRENRPSRAGRRVGSGRPEVPREIVGRSRSGDGGLQSPQQQRPALPVESLRRRPDDRSRSRRSGGDGGRLVSTVA